MAGPSNPQFDRRILTAKHLSRGRIVSNQTNLPVRSRPSLNFLYNPSVVRVSHQMNTDAFTPDVANPGDVGTVVGEAGSISFDLLFDRTYELWDRSLAHTPAGMRGVYTDVVALYRLCNMIGDVIGGGDWTGGSGWGTPTPTGALAVALNAANAAKPIQTNSITNEYLAITPMTLVQALFFFGGGKNSLRFQGWITGADIQYTHWNHNMVPMRCTVSINATMGMNPPNVAAMVTPPKPAPTTSNAKKPATVAMGAGMPWLSAGPR